MLNVEAYVLAKKYTDESIAGAGAIKGAPCQVDSIVSIPGGNRITLSWEDDYGITHSDSFDVMDGVSPTISAETGNALEQRADGWYVADVQGVEISSVAGNIITLKSDGIYADAVQNIATGSTEGAISVDGTDVTVYTPATISDIDALFS
ncbi:MAG: hypothetical protein J6T34_01260 [Bacilli bacterium]|nr:hypothetical protein [Bacilli bacterium]